MGSLSGWVGLKAQWVGALFFLFVSLSVSSPPIPILRTPISCSCKSLGVGRTSYPLPCPPFFSRLSINEHSCLPSFFSRLSINEHSCLLSLSLSQYKRRDFWLCIIHVYMYIYLFVLACSCYKCAYVCLWGYCVEICNLPTSDGSFSKGVSI